MQNLFSNDTVSLILFLSLFFSFVYAIVSFVKKKKRTIDNMSGLDFELYIAKVLKDNGYKVIHTKSSHDFGADLIVKNVGPNNKTIVIQLKRYSGTIPIGAVQEVFSAMYYYDADISVVLTNNYFSASACQLADKIGVHLWDRKHLLAIIKGQRLESYLSKYL